MADQPRTFWREMGAWMVAASLLLNGVTVALLWWLVIASVRDPRPAFTVMPAPSTVTDVKWGKDGYVIVTKPVDPKGKP